ncbi:MAG: serine/threonine-protein kinase [Myxococcota bacterium]
MSMPPEDGSVPQEDFQPFTLGRYQVLAPLGSGGMARVFLAEQRGVGGFAKRVVIKQIHDQLATNERFVKMFVDEANISVNLKHANVVQVLELQQEGRNLFMVLEFVDGTDLNTMFNALVDNGQQMPLDLAIFVVNQALAGLAHAHAAKGPDGQPLNLIHRDVTPGNVLLSRSGEVKLSDFGVARAAGRMTQTVVGEVKGKYSYMAPEVMQGDAYDQRSDIFGAGVVLWEALTTRPLFRGKSDFHVMEQVLRGPIHPPSVFNPAVPKELDAVVLQALERDVEKRFQSSRTFKRALGAFMPDDDPDALAEKLAALVSQYGPPISLPPPSPAPRSISVPVMPAAAPASSSGSSPPTPAPPSTPPPPRASTPPSPAPAAPAPADDDFFSTLDVPPPAPAPAPVPLPHTTPPRGMAASSVSDQELDAVAAAFEAGVSGETELPILEPEPGPRASAPAEPPITTLLRPPAPGEPAFQAQLGADKRVHGPISTASTLAILQRRDLTPADKLGVFRGPLVPLGEVGRLLMLDHLVKATVSNNPPTAVGTVRDQGVARLLTGLTLRRQTGVLLLRSDPTGNRAAVYLHEGALQYSFVPDPNEHLLALFLRHQAQGLAVLPQILTLVLRDRLPLPRVMAKVAQLSGARITMAVGSLSRDRLVNALAWEDCRFAFFPGVKDPYELPPGNEPLLASLPPVFARLHSVAEIHERAMRLVERPLALAVADPKLVADMGVQPEAELLHQALSASPRLRDSWARMAPPGSREENRLKLTLVLLEQCGALLERTPTRA